MSSSIKRRHSNKQGLQNLIRVTAQRSQEDAEEVERERRRRSREKPREQWEHGDQGGRPTWSPSPNPPQDSSLTPPKSQYDEEVKPPQSRLVLEEDEGFSDWTQRLENRKESLLRQEQSRRCEESRFTHKQKFKHQEEEDEEEHQESITTPGTSRYSEEKICDRKKDIVISCSSSVFNLPQKARNLEPTIQPRNISSLDSPTQRDLDLADGGGAGAFQSLDEAYQTHRDRGEREVGELKRREEEQQQDKADLHYSLDERCRLQEVEVEHSRPQQEVESHMTTQEGERSSEGVNQQMQTTHSNHGDVLETNPYGPMGPTMRRTLPPTAVSKIDNRVDNYAIKDAEGLKVGVADLINQWVKGSPDGTRSSSPTKPAEIKPGDVLSKKNLWENLGDSLSPGRGGKGSSPGKRYRFVVAGHGKYEKVAVDDNDYSEYDNYQSGHR
ncbi:Caldesmon [Merluccius polli]|uniref:Caldesmon n=1 Tax=Merluccius polli TaxID=89951 RepID=A0AA47NZ66_MERPO|nr:Caldesmon [Merluccius polli]